MAWFRFDPDAPAVGFDDLLGNAQTGAGVFALIGGFESLKQTEYLLMVFPVNARTVVGHTELHPVLSCSGRDDDPALGFVDTPHGILQETGHHLAQCPLRGDNRRTPGVHLHPNVRGDLDPADNAGNKGLHINSRGPALRSSGASVVQHTVEQMQRAPRPPQQQVQLRHAGFIEALAVVGQQPFGQRGDASNRRLEIVRGGLGEILHLPVGAPQLDHGARQLLVDHLEIALNSLAVFDLDMQLLEHRLEATRHLSKTQRQMSHFVVCIDGQIDIQVAAADLQGRLGQRLEGPGHGTGHEQTENQRRDADPAGGKQYRLAQPSNRCEYLRRFVAHQKRPIQAYTVRPAARMGMGQQFRRVSFRGLGA